MHDGDHIEFDDNMGQRLGYRENTSKRKKFYVFNKKFKKCIRCN